MTEELPLSKMVGSKENESDLESVKNPRVKRSAVMFVKEAQKGVVMAHDLKIHKKSKPMVMDCKMKQQDPEAEESLTKKPHARKIQVKETLAKELQAGESQNEESDISDSSMIEKFVSEFFASEMPQCENEAELKNLSKKEKLVRKNKEIIEDTERLRLEIKKLSICYRKIKKERSRCLQIISEDSKPLQQTGKFLPEELAAISSEAIGVIFSDITRLVVRENLLIFCAKGTTEFVTFSFEVELEEDRRINSLIFKFQEESLEKELGRWRRGLMAEGNLQMLVRGCRIYSQLLSRMNELLGWIFENYTELFIVNYTGLSGTVLQSNKKDEVLDIPVLTLHWKIVWKECEYNMADCFVVEMPDMYVFDEEMRAMFDTFTQKTTYTEENIEVFLLSVANALVMIRE